MTKLFHKEMTRKAMLEYFGDFNMASGYRQYTLDEGKAKDVQVCELSNGTGLRFEILKTRGMDLGRCYYKEMPISYCSYQGDVHPSYYEAYHDGWLRSFAGGLLVTGGLTSMGAPLSENGESLPLHGRISNIPAESFHVENTWQGNEQVIVAKGSVRESKALCYNIVLTRVITMKAGVNTFQIHDEIYNEGFEDQEQMMLYHFNIGYPLLDEDSKLYCNTKEIIPRDRIAQQRDEPYDTYVKPTNHYPDVVYYHDLEEDQHGKCHVVFVNKTLELGIALSFDKAVLDQFTQWKFTGKGNYVAGIEPGNARVNGRDVERKEGRLKILKAQESIAYDIEVSILDGEVEIMAFLKQTGLML